MTKPREAERNAIAQAMDDPDRLVVEFDYMSADGSRTRRVASPVRWTRDKNGFLALCLGREECRTFAVKRCRNVRLAKAADHVMPVAVQELD